MISFAYEYGPERANDLITILKMNNEVYPNSTETLIWLAQAHLAINEKEEARKYLNNALKIEPGNQKVRKLLFIINGN
jgi:cytochrome c-type biogenesis protein CcmH/NrfG